MYLKRNFLLIPLLVIISLTIMLTGCVEKETANNKKEEEEEEPFQPAEVDGLTVGVDSTNITPPEGIFLEGYDFRTAKGVRDNLHATALVFDNTYRRAVVITVDVFTIATDWADDIRERISAETNISKSYILISSVHSHSAPSLRYDAPNTPWLTDDWTAAVADSLVAVVKRADSKRVPGRIGYGEDQISFAINRRKVEGGVAIAAPNPAGEVDNRIKVLRVDETNSSQEDKPLAVISHAVCHPNVFRSDKQDITADFPSEARKQLYSNYGYTNIFLQGACGDIRPNLVDSEGNFRSGTDEDMVQIGTELSNAVNAAYMFAGNNERTSNYRMQASTEDLRLDDLSNKTITVEIQALRIANTIFVGLPGEPFVNIGREIENQVGAGVDIVVVAFANGYEGHIAEASEYDLGGYELNYTTLARGSDQKIIEKAVQLAKAVK